MDKDYTLLRPFDPEKAKAGEAMCYVQNGERRTYVAGPDVSENIVVSNLSGVMIVNHSSAYRMVPLSWLEGKPAYEGDEAYGKLTELSYVATKEGWMIEGDATTYPFTLNEVYMTWTKPSPKTVKRTVKYLAYEDLLGVVLHVREGGYVDRRWTRLQEFDLSREIEEEAK